MKIKVITLQQPYAHYCIYGHSFIEFLKNVTPDIKDVENRSWPTAYRGRLYIHAGKTWYNEDYTKDFRGHLYPVQQMAQEMGHIIGHVDLVDCVTESRSPWFFGPYGFVLEDPQEIEWIPARGSLGIWNYELREGPGNADDA
jgi:hypothetical protein